MSLYCAINVRWPQVQGEDGKAVMGGESSLSPAVVVYGVVPTLPGIQFMQIDNKGMVSHAQGKLAGETLTTRMSCSMQGACQSITRITARPGSKDIVMLVDVEIDSRRVLRHAFLMHRVSNIQLGRGEFNVKPLGELQAVGER